MPPPLLLSLTEGPNILLDKPILLVGRHQECDIQIASRKISRRHCCIAQVHDHLVIRDLCSTNGIRINGVRVNEGILKAGDKVTIGNFQYEVDWNGAAVARELPGVAQPFAADATAPRASVDPLESAEEPVALPDSPEVVRVAPPAQLSPEPPMPSLILPDNLHLAPKSGEKEPPPPG